MKKANLEQLIPGKKYYTECGLWKGVTTFVGSFQFGKRIKYRFTYGDAANWLNQFGHCVCKSAIKVFELD